MTCLVHRNSFFSILFKLKNLIQREMVKSMNTFFLSLLGWFSPYTAVTITLCLQIHSVLASILFPIYPTI